MAQVCQTCSSQIADGARFCGTCGMPAPTGEVPAGAPAAPVGPGGGDAEWVPDPAVFGTDPTIAPLPPGDYPQQSYPQQPYPQQPYPQQPHGQPGVDPAYPPTLPGPNTGLPGGYGPGPSGVPQPPPGGAGFGAPPPRQESKNRLPLILLGCGLVLALVAGGILLARRRDGNTSTTGPTDTTTATPGDTTPTSGGSAATTAAVNPATTAPPVTEAPTTTEAFVPCPAQAGAPVQVSGRQTLLHSPPVAGTRAPALILLDGSEGAPALIESYSKAGSRLAARGVIVAEPAGSPSGKTSATGVPLTNWAISSNTAFSSGPPTAADVDLITAVVRSLVTERCADPARIMIAGLSAGATAALRLACAVDPAAAGFDGFTAVAMVAPVVTANMFNGPALFTCTNSVTFDLMAVTGTADTVVPSGGGGRFNSVSMTSWFGSLVSPTLGCAAAPAAVYSPGTDPAPQPPPCGSGRALLLTVNGLGHAWPGGEPIGFSSQSLSLAQFLSDKAYLAPTTWDFTAYLHDLFVASW